MTNTEKLAERKAAIAASSEARARTRRVLLEKWPSSPECRVTDWITNREQTKDVPIAVQVSILRLLVRSEYSDILLDAPGFVPLLADPEFKQAIRDFS